MPSRGERARRLAERLLHAAAVAVVGWMLWASLTPSARDARTVVTTAALLDALPRWSATAAPETVHVAADTLPDPARRAWLVALRRAGTRVSWSAPGVEPTAAEVSPAADPRGGATVLVAAPTGSRVRLEDEAGALDSAVVRGTGAAWRTPALVGAVRATVGRQAAVARIRDSLVERRLLVLGTAGWEAKFVVAALEERGWVVHARLRVAPGVDVAQGSLGAIDTARYAAVIALDTAAAGEARRIAGYARGGGGVVVAGNAATVAALAPVAPGRAAERARAAAVSFAGTEPRRALGFHVVRPIKRDAVVLESRDGRAAVVARREGAGRVVQVGYDETWRWRLAGGDGAPDAHREWWSAVVAGAAYRPAMSIPTGDTLRVAPLAQTVDALGPPTPRPAGAPLRARGPAMRAWMLWTLFALLLAEWGSRRLRGAP